MRGYKRTKEDFIQDAIKIHGDKYDYSKVEFKGVETKVCIICPKHGEFWQTPFSHLHGTGCPQCARESGRKTKEEFIAQSIKIHGDKYDYSKVEYKTNRTKVCIICPEHGEFWQKPIKHLNGCSGCPQCAKQNAHRCFDSYTTEQFITEAKNKFGEKFDYSKTVYKSYKENICVVCPIHGEFWISPTKHLKIGCPKCVLNSKSFDIEEWKNKVYETWGDRYDISNSVYDTKTRKINIRCKEHGIFWTRPRSFVKKGHAKGCPVCGRKIISTEDFVQRAKEKFGNYYDYSLVEYIDERTPIKIICPKHGIFLQSPATHLSALVGCPNCASDWLANETKLYNILLNHYPNIEIKRHYRNFDFLERLEYDFFFEKEKIAIEYQGAQHYKPSEYFGGEESFKKQQERDKRKKELSVKNNITLFEFSFDKKLKNEPNLITNLDELLKRIDNKLAEK